MKSWFRFLLQASLATSLLLLPGRADSPSLAPAAAASAPASTPTFSLDPSFAPLKAPIDFNQKTEPTIPYPDETPAPAPQPSEDLQRTQAEIDAARAMKEKNQNWLVIGYEQQMKVTSGAENPADGDAAALGEAAAAGSDKDLSPLSALSPTGTDGITSPSASDPGKPQAVLHTGLNDPAREGPKIRTDPLSEGDSARNKSDGHAAGGSIRNPDFFRPLVTPLSGTNTAGLPSFFSSPDEAEAAKTSNELMLTPGTGSLQAQDPNAVAIPGLTAAESDPSSLPADTSLDMLPGESVEQAKEHPDNFVLPALPVETASGQLEKQQATELGTPLTLQSPAAPTITMSAPEPEHSSSPQAGVFHPTQIQSPFDFLNR